MKSWSQAMSADGTVGMGVKLGSCSGGMRLVEWKSGRAPSVTRGKAKLHHVMVEALSSYSFQTVEVPMESRWSLYSNDQTCGFGHSEALPRVFPLHPIPSALTQHLT